MKGAYSIVKALDSRQVYYTSRNIKDDICRHYVDFKGINIRSRDIGLPAKIIDALSSTGVSTGNNVKPYFISSFGIAINNENESGFAFCLKFRGLPEIHSANDETPIIGKFL